MRLLAAALGVVLMTACSAGGSTAEEVLSGSDLATTKNCVSCHTVSGARSVGPTWRSVAGSEVALEDGRVVMADDEYLIRSIRQPQADIVAGFTTVTMPTIDLTDQEIEALVDHIRSLGRGGELG